MKKSNTKVAKQYGKDTNVDNSLVCIKHRIMDNKCLSGGRDTSSKHKMMIIAHMEQHSIGPRDICYKFIPRMLAFSNQSYG
jgi:hypothetical protein